MLRHQSSIRCWPVNHQANKTMSNPSPAPVRMLAPIQVGPQVGTANDTNPRGSMTRPPTNKPRSQKVRGRTVLPLSRSIDMRERDPSAKAIVFSQYVAFLDLLEHRLLVAGIRVVKLNGGMTAGAREAAEATTAPAGYASTARACAARASACASSRAWA